MRHTPLAILALGLLATTPAGTDVRGPVPEIRLAADHELEVRFEDAIGRQREIRFPDPWQRSIEIEAAGIRARAAGLFGSPVYAVASLAEREARAAGRAI